MSERWAELRLLFDELAELDQDARLARLRQIGASDASLREQLEAMLLADGSETGLNKYVEAAARSINAGTAPRTEGDPLGLVGSKIGPYRVDCLLGAGGMGVVYQATDERLGRIVAVKFLPPVWNLNEQAKRRFLHEARAASSLDHTNVCTIYEADETSDGTLYIVMACYEGETLKRRLERGTFRIDEALDLARQAAQGLAAAHARDLVHRDVKPANLLITTDNTLKILDFGIAKAGDLGLTMPGERPGTAAYMAPEQADGEAVDSRADVWSLGVVLYEMLAGMRPAFGGGADAQSSLTEARPEVSPALARITGRCLAQQPDDRYASARDMAQALAALQAPIPATAPRGLSRGARAGIAVLALVAFASVAALVTWQVHDRRIRIARTEAIPQIEQLANDNQIVEAFLLAEEAARLAPEDPVLRGLVNRLSVPVDINSEPLGAEVSYQDYRTADGPFHTLGRTPLDSIRVPAPMNVLRWRVEQEGYDTLEIAETSILGALNFDLVPVGEAPPGMHLVPAGSEHFQANEPNEVPAFWLDTYEVTNREFQAFVDAGAMTNRATGRGRWRPREATSPGRS